VTPEGGAPPPSVSGGPYLEGVAITTEFPPEHAASGDAPGAGGAPGRNGGPVSVPVPAEVALDLPGTASLEHAEGEPEAKLAPARPAVPPVHAAAVAELQRSLGVTHVTAQALVRRDLADPADARKWLAGRTDEVVELPGLANAVELVLHHVRAGNPILVHGDYDVDGVAATAILLDTLELLGADPKWHLPKRGVDGYGLTAASLERIGRLQPKLVITVDCGITAVDETALLRDAGIDVLITDHHLPRGDGVLPDTAILHPGVMDGELIDRVGEPCGAGVAADLANGLLKATGHGASPLRDGIAELAALATIADCVPLVDGNRTAVRDGLGALARTRRPGLRALLRSARVDPTTLDGMAVAFRLSPRLNAAGRMSRADLALALVRARTDDEATRLAEELERCNLQRREVELSVRRKAEQQVRELGERSGYVLAGENWPAGVIGIVASRIAEQTDRPAVVLSIDGDRATGSARSAQGLDLAGLFAACAEHLTKFGGHAAAAGCELEPANIPAFTAAFDAAAAEALKDAPPIPGPVVDAVAEVRDLTLALADELAAFEPTGEGNPAVRLLLPSVRVIEESPMGTGNEHRRAVISSGGARTKAVAFSSPPLPLNVPLDLVVQLERSTFGGTVEARVVVRSVHPLDRPSQAADAKKVGIDAGAIAALLAGYHEDIPAPTRPPAPGADKRGASVAAVLRVAAACGREPIAYAADPARRAVQLEGLGWRGTVVGPAGLQSALELAAPEHGVVICVDPPIDPRAAAALASNAVEAWWSWTDAELTYGVHALEREFALRPLMVSLFRGLREAGKPVPALGLLKLLPDGHAPAALGRAVRVLDELGLVDVADGLASVELVSQAASDPTQSSIYRNALAVVEEARSWSLLSRQPA
jgi:single-stranded-DNA-specific exonuclease